MPACALTYPFSPLFCRAWFVATAQGRAAGGGGAAAGCHCGPAATALAGPPARKRIGLPAKRHAHADAQRRDQPGPERSRQRCVTGRGNGEKVVEGPRRAGLASPRCPSPHPSPLPADAMHTSTFRAASQKGRRLRCDGGVGRCVGRCRSRVACSSFHVSQPSRAGATSLRLSKRSCTLLGCLSVAYNRALGPLTLSPLLLASQVCAGEEPQRSRGGGGAAGTRACAWPWSGTRRCVVSCAHACRRLVFSFIGRQKRGAGGKGRQAGDGRSRPC